MSLDGSGGGGQGRWDKGATDMATAQRVASSRRCLVEEGGEKTEGEDGEEGFLAPPTSSSHPGGGGGGLEGLHLVLFRTMQRSEGGFWSAGC